MLKLDCEGAEYPILLNLPSETYARTDRIVLECHGTDLATMRADSARLVERLVAEGYRIDAYLQHEGMPCGAIRCRRPGA